MQLRYETWRRAVRSAASKPLGRGVGTVGGASSPDRAHVVTTDNSFLKVLIEQGVIGVAMFLAAMLSAVILLARRLRAATGDARTLGLPALAGFVTFLGISATGETVEQPGKVVAWVLLGMAVAQALGRLEPREGERA
jgi:O-antigen ligase